MVRQAFNRAAAAKEGSKPVDFLEAILRERPDLKGQLAYFPGEYWEDKAEANDNELRMPGHIQGGNAHTVFIGSEVFKGPRFLDRGLEGKGPDSSRFDKEPEVLQQLEGHDLPIPKVTCVGQESIFYGMTRMPGIALPYNFLETFTKRQIDLLAKDIARFMVGTAKILPQDDKGCFAVHGDLQAKNIVIDPVTKRLSGIVDFGMIYYYDSFDDVTPACFGGRREYFQEILQRECNSKAKPSKKTSNPHREAMNV